MRSVPLRRLALTALLLSCAALAAPAAQAYDERPMRLPAAGAGRRRRVRAAVELARRGRARRRRARAPRRSPRRFGARKLRGGAVYRVATARARAFAAALRAAARCATPSPTSP